MRVASIAVDLRPRSMYEASDLGVRLAGSCSASVLRSVGPVYAVVLLLACSTFEISHWLPPLTLFCMKPWLDRSLLFVLARAIFGQPTTFADLWAARADVWWSQLLPTLTRRRLSLWRSYVAPVQQLEGQPWRERGRRVRQLLRGRHGVAFATQGGFSTAENVIAFGAMALLFWLTPGDKVSGAGDLLFGDAPLRAFLQFACYALAVAIVEPCFVGAGFGMYLNRRVELEAWDIEQEFRLAFAA